MSGDHPIKIDVSELEAEIRHQKPCAKIALKTGEFLIKRVKELEKEVERLKKFQDTLCGKCELRFNCPPETVCDELLKGE